MLGRASLIHDEIWKVGQKANCARPLESSPSGDLGPMRPLITVALATAILAANPGPLRAEHAKINLDVSSSGEQVAATVDQTPGGKTQAIWSR